MRPLLATLSAVLVTSAAAFAGTAPAAAQDSWFVFRLPDRPGIAQHHFGPRPFEARRTQLQEWAEDALAFACSPQRADGLAMTLDGVDRRLDLTADQRTLFEDLRTTALVAQTDFADSCADFPRDPDSLVERLEFRKANLTAQLAALEVVLPKLDAFYASLTADQQSALEPQGQRSMRMVRSDRAERAERPPR